MRITSSCVEDISPDTFSAILQAIATNQIELTTLSLINHLVHSQPSLRSVSPTPHSLPSLSNHPAGFLLDQALHRLLLNYSGDTFVLLLCLAKCSRQEASRLLLSTIQTAMLLPTPVASQLSRVGTAYAFLTDDAHCLQVFREKEVQLRWRRLLRASCRGSELTRETVLQCLPEVVRQNKCGLPRKLRCRYAFEEVEELCGVAHIAPAEAAKQVVATLLDLRDATRLKEYLAHLTAALSHEECKDVLEEAVQAVSGTEYALLSLLVSFLLPLLPQSSAAAAETTRLLQLQRLLEFTASHQTLLPQTDVKQLLNEPWSQLERFVTWYNYPHYLLVFSLASLSMDQVLFHLLDRVCAAAAPPEWLALSAFIAGFPPVADAVRLARFCLAVARKYAHAAGEQCSTFPCALCQDRIDAARKALELCHAALLNVSEAATLPEAEIDARSQLTRACRVDVSSAVIQTQWNRLFLGSPSLPLTLRAKLNAEQVHAHFSALQHFLEGVFASAACACGVLLQHQYSRLCFLQWRASQRWETGQNPGRKRAAAVRVVRSYKRRSYDGETGVTVDITSLLQRQRETMQQTATEEELRGYVFNTEAVGCLYLHAVMEAISSQCGLDYQEMTEHAMEEVLRMEVEVEVTGLCEEEKEERKEEACVWGLVYLLEGFFTIDFSLFVTEATRLLRSNAVVSPCMKYILHSAVARVLRSHPQSEALLNEVSSKDREVLDVKALEKAAMLFRVQENCQKFGIPVGGDVLAQVKNQLFFVNTIRMYKKNVDLLWWVRGVVKETKVCDTLVLNQLALACGEIDGEVGVKVGLVRVVVENEGREWMQDEGVMRVVRGVLMELRACAKDVVVERWEDMRVVCEAASEAMKEDVEAVIRAWVTKVESRDGELTRLLCDLVLFVMNDEERVTVLSQLGLKGDAARVLPFITCEGRVIEGYRSVFALVVRRMVEENQFEALFLSDYYEESVNVCCEEPALLRAWIVYHIKAKQYRNAYALIVRSGWESEENEMEALRDYVIEELKDESLLAYLLSFWSVCYKHDREKQTGEDTRSRAGSSWQASRPEKEHSAARRSPPPHHCPHAASGPCSTAPHASSPLHLHSSSTPRSRAAHHPPRHHNATASRSARRWTRSVRQGSLHSPSAWLLRHC